MLLYHLPDLVVWRICDFLPCEDIIRLSSLDWRITKHRNVKHGAAKLIQKQWRRMITRGRDYIAENNTALGTVAVTSAMRCFVQLCIMPSIDSPLKYHTVLPRRRVVIPKCKFDSADMAISRNSSLVCEFTTIPRVPLYIMANGTKYQVTSDSAIPICVLPFTMLFFVKPVASYICYTEVYFDSRTYFNITNKSTVECLNTNALVQGGYMHHSRFSYKNPRQIP